MKIEDALLHLVRNSIDHGIEAPDVRRARGKPEKGTLTLSARNRGAFVEVRIEDDGGGIDASKIAKRLVEKGMMSQDEVQTMSEDQLIQEIFRPGFSTVETVTDISGRGVGMDVVKKQIDAMGGSVQVITTPGEGSSFVLSLPVSASVTQAMVFRLDQGLYALPSAMIEMMLHVMPTAIEHISGRALFRHEDGSLIGLHDLGELLGFPGQPGQEAFWRIAILQLSDARVGLRIKTVLGERKLVQKASDPFVRGLEILSGTARIEGGELVSVLNVAELMSRAGARTAGTSSRAAASASGDAPAAAAPSGPQTVLVVEDSDITRRLLVGMVGKMGYRVVEAVNGRDGLEKFNASAPDLVMTDLDMPVMNGIELIRALRQQGVRLPLVVMTTRETPESKAEALAVGADAYLLKSTNSHDALSSTFSRLLTGAAERAAG